MNTSTLHGVTEARRRALRTGGILVVASAASCALALVDVQLGFVPLGILALWWIAKALGVGLSVPREKIGWLYASVIFVTCWAPALGMAGTVARFGLATVVIVTLSSVDKNKEPRLPGALRLGLAALVLSLLISTLGAASPAYGISRFLNWVMFLPLLWLAYYRPNPKGVVVGLVATGLFQMAGVGLQMAGLMQGTWGGLLTSGLTYNPETSKWLTRYTGFILNPNNLALVLACGVIALAACLLLEIPVRLKMLCAGFIGLFAFGIIASGSRGGLVAVGLGLSLLFFAAGRRGILLSFLAAVASLLVIQFAASQELDRLVSSFAEIASGTDASSIQRSGIWLKRLGEASGGELFGGGGFGGYAPSLFGDQQGFLVDPDLARRATVDNSWLKTLLESGFTGVVGLALTLLFPMFGSIFRSTGDRRLWGIATGSVLIACIWRSLSADMIDQNPWNAIFFLAAGMAAASFKNEPIEACAVGASPVVAPGPR